VDVRPATLGGVNAITFIASIKGDPVKRRISPMPPERGFCFSGVASYRHRSYSDPARSFMEGTEREIRTEHPSGLTMLNNHG